MRAGELRHKVTIQQRTDTQNSAGEPIPAWSTYKTAWVAIEPLSGREAEIAKQTYGEVTHRLRGRQVDLGGTTPKMRVIKGAIDGSGEPTGGARLLEIEGVVNVGERDREVHLFCTEHV